MLLSAYINAWDGIELLRGCIKCLQPHVDKILIVWQKKSNYGEEYNPIEDIHKAIEGIENIHLVEYHPNVIRREWTGFSNERAKRGQAIASLRKIGCTHFLAVDVDEYYEDFGQAKQQFIDSGHHGSVVKMWTYFKRPTWRLEKSENYYVPFIHTMTPKTQVGPEYPFYVDRTRRINQMDVVELPTMMHHFSWVRQNIERKIRNSSAKNLSLHLGEYNELDRPKHLRMYDQRLIEVPNIFNIDLSVPTL